MIKVAIASDIHAFGASTEGTGFVSAKSDQQQPHRNALLSLIEFVKKSKLRADYLLCPGDLGEKADVEGIAYAWRSLDELAKALGGAQLIATTGNHDVDSRHKYNKFDPDGFLR